MVWPKTREQRCWVKSANILNKLPKSQQPRGKRMLQDIWMAENEEGRRGGVRRLRRHLRRQIREGRRMPEEGPGPVARLLRLPGRTFGNTCARPIC